MHDFNPAVMNEHEIMFVLSFASEFDSPPWNFLNKVPWQCPDNDFSNNLVWCFDHFVFLNIRENCPLCCLSSLIDQRYIPRHAIKHKVPTFELYSPVKVLDVHCDCEYENKQTNNSISYGKVQTEWR